MKFFEQLEGGAIFECDGGSDMIDEASVINALQVIQAYCEEQESCDACCLRTAHHTCSMAQQKKPEMWKIWVGVRL